MNGITREELRELIKETVRETLSALGMDTGNPIEVQADLRSLREWRLMMRKVRWHSTITIVGIIVTGACAALWLGIKAYIKKGD